MLQDNFVTVCFSLKNICLHKFETFHKLPFSYKFSCPSKINKYSFAINKVHLHPSSYLQFMTTYGRVMVRVSIAGEETEMERGGGTCPGPWGTDRAHTQIFQLLTPQLPLSPSCPSRPFSGLMGVSRLIIGNVFFSVISLATLSQSPGSEHRYERQPLFISFVILAFFEKKKKRLQKIQTRALSEGHIDQKAL